MEGGEAPLPAPQAGPLDALAALERSFDEFISGRPLVAHGGRVTEVSPTHYRAHGLSGAARLGDLV
jgi:flagellum-specific ATP synthase